ncbi:MAG: sigma-70 family RNA polymerase sigma factor [Candidatus Staskawiczbacteria bacterium]|jgi:RNA polymerase primary sigma factor
MPNKKSGKKFAKKLEKKAEKRAKTFLDVYFEQMGDKIPLLSADEEIAFAERIEAGDKEASRQLARANLGLVVHIAKEYAGKSNLMLLHLIQEGNYGLMLAVDGFRNQGTRFSTYATECINGAIKNALSGKRELTSLDAPIGSGDDEESLYAIVGDEKAVSPSRGADKGFLREVVEGALSELDRMERKVLVLSFGLKDGIARSKKEVAKILGIKTEKVRQIKEMALKKMRKHKKIGDLSRL